jgi:uncharacterized protein YdaT
MRFISTALSLGGAVMLAGCFAGDVSVVKESRMTGWSQFTVGQLLDKRKACSSVEWKSFKDTRDRSVVEYTCESAGGAAYLESLHALSVKSAQDRFSGASQHDAGFAEIAKHQSKFTQEVSQNQRDELANRQELIANLQRDITRIQGITLASCRDVDASSLSRALSDFIQSFQKGCAKAIKENEPRDLEIDKNVLIRTAQTRISDQQSAIANLKTQMEMTQSRAEQDAARAEKDKVAREQAAIKQRKDAQAELAALERQWANVKGVREVSQWVMQGNEPIYLASRIDLVLADKTIEVPVTARLVFDQAAKDGEVLTSAYEFALREAWNRYPMKP